MAINYTNTVQGLKFGNPEQPQHQTQGFDAWRDKTGDVETPFIPRVVRSDEVSSVSVDAAEPVWPAVDRDDERRFSAFNGLGETRTLRGAHIVPPVQSQELPPPPQPPAA